MTTDFRDVFGEVVTKHLGADRRDGGEGLSRATRSIARKFRGVLRGWHRSAHIIRPFRGWSDMRWLSVLKVSVVAGVAAATFALVSMARRRRAGARRRHSARERQARSQRPVAGGQHAPTGTSRRTPRRRRWRCVPARSSRSPPRKCSRSARSARFPSGAGVVEGDELPYTAEGLKKKQENQAELADARSGDQVLPPRRAARDLHAVPVSDHPEQRRGVHRVRIRGRGAAHLPEGSRTAADRQLDGHVARRVGRRHVRRPHLGLQRSVVVRSRRQSSLGAG